jgi:hypothetical protein
MVRVVCADVQMVSTDPSMIRGYAMTDMAQRGYCWFGQDCPKFRCAPVEPVVRGSMHHCTPWGTTIHYLYKDQKDEALHQRAIEKLARKLNRAIPPVKVVYENEYAQLKIDAKVTNFLGVFASRRARDVLLRMPT